jgi:hypothetical protein
MTNQFGGTGAATPPHRVSAFSKAGWEEGKVCGEPGVWVQGNEFPFGAAWGVVESG